MRRPLWGLTLACALLLGPQAGRRAEAAEQPPKGIAIQQKLRQWRETGSVLYVAAHPDDENTQLITYLARGRGYRTAYLSLTRGDGGQNVIGGEFGDALGVIRTQELLAARRLDGAQQFFTRALDFGFSKDVQETLRIWDHQQVLGDVVRVIRTFRPDVVITRFSPEAGGTHGHHTASAVLAVEAFKLAGDPKAFPEQLGTLKPWQPKRILQNGRGAGTLSLNTDGTDTVLGESFAKIAGRSRAMHISQGFANFTGSAENRPETFALLGGEPAAKDIFDGIDTTWGRYPGGAEIGRLAGEAGDKFNPAEPAASVPGLLQLRARLAALPADTVTDEKLCDLDDLIRQCAGITVETTVPQADVVQGQTLKLRQRVSLESAVPVRLVAIKYPSTGTQDKVRIDLKPGESTTRETIVTMPPATPVSQPYWLRQEPAAGMARVDDANLIGRPENPPVFPVQYVFELGGQTLVVPSEPIQASTETGAAPANPTRLEVVPPVSLRMTPEVRLFAPGASRPVVVEVLAARAAIVGTVGLDIPAGWKVQPAVQQLRLAAAGDRVRLSFTVTAPAQATTAEIAARALVGGTQVRTQRVEINYPHIPRLLLQPAARQRAVVLDLATRGREVGYLPGAGDSVAEAIEEMGYAVTRLSGADLTPEKLRRFDAVVLGVRALNVRTDLAAGMPAMLAYVEGGGNLIVQYNRPNDLKTTSLAPFPLTLSGQRVTNENAPVTFLAPGHPALNTPNKITPADFDGWVQERGIYFPSQWDDRFTPLLASGDPGEEPLKGGLLIARHGKGNFVYTGLVWFRQLPAGVPGAYRLFANLISLGK